MKPQKFIIYDNTIILGRVNLHKQLLPENYNQNLVQGGGLFILNKENKTVTLYGTSHDFGPFNKILANQTPFENNQLNDFNRIIQ